MNTITTVFKILSLSLNLGERIYKLFKKDKTVNPLSPLEIEAVAKSAARVARDRI